MKNNNDGFTLVELLAVMVIIAILVSVSLPVMAGIVNHTKRNTYISEARRAAEVTQTLIMELYAEDNFDHFEFAITAYNVMNPEKNPVARRMDEDSYTLEARIQEVGLNEDTLKLNYMEYHVDSYKILLDFKREKVIFK